MLPVLLLLMIVTVPAVADEAPVTALPGNPSCSYPDEAQKSVIAGTVRFVAQIRPDGSTESVDVVQVPVPLPERGFETSVRDCVLQWRFEPAPAGQTALRRYAGMVQFRLNAQEESALRDLMEALAAAWNAGDMAAVEALAVKDSDVPGAHFGRTASLAEELLGQTGGSGWQMRLAPELQLVWFLNERTVRLEQAYRRAFPDALAPEPREFVLDANVAKGLRGWRFVRLSSGWRTRAQGR